MITKKQILQKCLRIEYDNYFSSMGAYIKAMVLGERNYSVWRYQKNLRELEYFKNMTVGGGKKIVPQYNVCIL